MNVLIRSVKIIDSNSPHNSSVTDIHIVNGIIKTIKPNINTDDSCEIIELDGLYVSPAWFDAAVDFCDPGFEHKEDIETGLNAAIAGGFTAVGILPNTNSVVDNKAVIDYIKFKAKASSNICEAYPHGASTKNLDNIHLSEMYEMYRAGTIAFTGGFKPIKQTGTMLRTLQYVLPFNGCVINLPEDETVSHNAQMNEGIISTQMGTKGNPNIAELIMIKRDIELVKYTNSKVHFIQISTAEAVEEIRLAKKQGIKVTTSVSPWHLAFTDEKLIDFDTNWKISPPLRAETDRQALLNGLLDGTIDFVTSFHRPQDEDCKLLEFDKADFGIIGLQTTYPILNELNIGSEKIVECLSTKPRQILGINVPVIKEGKKANLTLFQPQKEFILTKEIIKSKAKNTPLLNTKLKGSVVGVINNGYLALNQ
ncbi:UNVERIFIED_CONTAM: hypothetical protein GTU68_061711 [Idotea baltica]|nr:hypothetical protein [Idotea baltica]